MDRKALGLCAAAATASLGALLSAGCGSDSAVTPNVARKESRTASPPPVVVVRPQRDFFTDQPAQLSEPVAEAPASDVLERPAPNAPADLYAAPSDAYADDAGTSQVVQTQPEWQDAGAVGMRDTESVQPAPPADWETESTVPADAVAAESALATTYGGESDEDTNQPVAAGENEVKLSLVPSSLEDEPSNATKTITLDITPQGTSKIGGTGPQRSRELQPLLVTPRTKPGMPSPQMPAPASQEPARSIATKRETPQPAEQADQLSPTPAQVQAAAQPRPPQADSAQPRVAERTNAPTPAIEIETASTAPRESAPRESATPQAAKPKPMAIAAAPITQSSPVADAPSPVEAVAPQPTLAPGIADEPLAKQAASPAEVPANTVRIAVPEPQPTASSVPAAPAEQPAAQQPLTRKHAEPQLAAAPEPAPARPVVQPPATAKAEPQAAVPTAAPVPTTIAAAKPAPAAEPQVAAMPAAVEPTTTLAPAPPLATQSTVSPVESAPAEVAPVTAAPAVAEPVASAAPAPRPVVATPQFRPQVAAAPAPSPVVAEPRPTAAVPPQPTRSVDTVAAAPVTSVRSPTLIASLARADERVRHAIQLAEKGAMYAARKEFTSAISLIAQARDVEHGTRQYSQATSAGFQAIKEASDFIKPGSSEANLTRVVAGHKTPVLKQVDVSDMPPTVAAQYYYNFAKDQLAAGIGRETVGSIALYGLGKLVIAGAGSNAQQLEYSGTAMAFYQAALICEPQNFRAAHELGVLLAGSGQLEMARELLMGSIGNSTQPTMWKNLAVVHSRLGEQQLANQANQKAEVLKQTAPDPRTPSVQWVDAATFANLGANGETTPPPPPAAAPNAAAPAKTPANVARKRTEWNPLNLRR